MSLRCGCYNEADDIVFGPVHECSKDLKLQYDASVVQTSWGPLRSAASVERPYERVLSDDVEPGDLG